jgi:hypothetical protein
MTVFVAATPLREALFYVGFRLTGQPTDEEMKEARRERLFQSTVKALRPDSGEDRGFAAQYFSLYGDESCIETLINVVDDSNWEVRYWALEGLRRLTGRDFGHNRGAWKAWYEENSGR